MSSCNFGTSASWAREPMVEVILRCNEMDEGGMLIVNAGNSSDVTGGCFVLVVGFGGVKTICERYWSALEGNQNQTATNFARE